MVGSPVHYKPGGHHYSPIFSSSARAWMPSLTVCLCLGLHFLDFSSGDLILLTLSHPLPNPHSDFVVIHSSSPSEILKAHCPILNILYLVFIFFFTPIPIFFFFFTVKLQKNRVFTHQHPSTPQLTSLWFLTPVHHRNYSFRWVSEWVSDGCSVVYDSLWPHRLRLARLSCPWNSPGKNIGVGCHFLLFLGILLSHPLAVFCA